VPALRCWYQRAVAAGTSER